MKRCLLLLIIVLLFASCSDFEGEKDDIDYDNVEITFVSYNDEIDGQSKVIITDSLAVKRLNFLKNQSTIKWLGLPDKGTEFQIKLVYSNSSTGDKLLINIAKSTDSKPTIEYGSGTLFDNKYKNDELTNYILSLLKHK